MAESSIAIIVQVAATLLLGAFFGLDRRMRGYPDASPLHAVTAALGLMAMIVMRPQSASLVWTMAAAIGLSVVVVSGLRASLQAIAGSKAIFDGAGADTFTLAGALAAGCACGTGDVRSVAAVMMVSVVVSIFRPLERYAGSPFEHGDDHQERSAATLMAASVAPFAANDDTPPDRGDPLGR